MEEIIKDDEVIAEENDPERTTQIESDFTLIENEEGLSQTDLEKLKKEHQLSGDEEYVSVGDNLFVKRTKLSPIRGEDGILRGHCNTCHEDVEINERGRFNKCAHCGSYDLRL